MKIGIPESCKLKFPLISTKHVKSYLTFTLTPAQAITNGRQKEEIIFLNKEFKTNNLKPEEELCCYLTERKDTAYLPKPFKKKLLLISEEKGMQKIG